jgi:ribosome-associated heat shock protein Hsp15
MADGATMRLDRFFWYARLARTRSAAQTLCVGGRVRIDGRAVDRAHVAVRVGSILTWAAQDRVRVVRIVALPARRGPAPEAQRCYDELVEGHETPARPTPPIDAPRNGA